MSTLTRDIFYSINIIKELNSMAVVDPVTGVTETSVVASPPGTGGATSRLGRTGLSPGGTVTTQRSNVKPTVNFSNRRSETIDDDWRVRISLSSSIASQFYNDAAGNILSPLVSTNGVIFPYTPQIQVTYQANYTPQRVTHSNYQNYFYESSEVQAINLTGDFSAQNEEEAKYVLACIYFFRSVTKMFYGKSIYTGNPPPLVYLNGYGSHYFPNVPCLVTQFTHNMPNDVDYIETSKIYDNFSNSRNSRKNENSTRIPTISQIIVSLQPVYSKLVVADQFKLQEFANGKLLKGGFL
jgi:hypothetical protein